MQLLLNKSHGDCDYKSYRQISYENMRLMGPVISGIVECGIYCKCCAEKCVNRVVQHGLQHELELFKTEEKGWGVRTKNDLPKGIFLTNYSGDVLKKSEADKRRTTTYQFKLPEFQKDHSSNNNNSETEDSDDSSSDAESSGYNDDIDSDSETDSDSDEPIPKKSKKRLTSFRTSMKRGKVERYIIDGLDRGNISRFINVISIYFLKTSESSVFPTF